MEFLSSRTHQHFNSLYYLTCKLILNKKCSRIQIHLLVLRLLVLWEVISMSCCNQIRIKPLLQDCWAEEIVYTRDLTLNQKHQENCQGRTNLAESHHSETIKKKSVLVIIKSSKIFNYNVNFLKRNLSLTYYQLWWCVYQLAQNTLGRLTKETFLICKL